MPLIDIDVDGLENRLLNETRKYEKWYVNKIIFSYKGFDFIRNMTHFTIEELWDTKF